MNRIFYVKQDGKPEIAMEGSFSYGRVNAARDYAKAHLPGFEVCNSGEHVGYDAYRKVYCVGLVNMESQRGMNLWVYEPY